MQGVGALIIIGIIMFAILGGVTLLSHIYDLNGIKSKTVGDGQHGTARWARKDEIYRTYKRVKFEPELWRKGINLPKAENQGIIVGCESSRLAGTFGKLGTTALVDTGDVHALMIGAAGVGSAFVRV